MGAGWDSDKGGRDLPNGFGPWLAGFVDGEGNFDIHKQQRESGDYYYCRFELSLRADDGGVLQMLQRVLGGKVYYGLPGEGQNEKGRWEIVSREECLRLVDVFDRFPLQSKKARDFKIWREALAVSCAHAGTSRPDLMDPFWKDLRATRPYAGKVTDPVEFRKMAENHRWIAWLAGVMREAYRVMKPGAHGLVWALPRTSHWTATALEDAGFEVRDVVMHLFGTGFPKSLNVAKAIEAGGGPEAIRRLSMGGAYEPSGRGRVNYDHGGGSAMNGATGPVELSDAAKQWEGWGTALKPAAEHWILIRKPLGGTVAANVAEYGTGALNIDACRIGAEARPVMVRTSTVVGANSMSGASTGATSSGETTTLGRWPATVTLDEEAAAALDAQSGFSKSPGKVTRGGKRGLEFGMARQENVSCPSDSGGASRFYYVAKPSRSERDAGCEHLPVKSGGEATDREDGSAGVDNPRAGAGRTGGARNFHPTVKSIALMRWLVRLITPPGGCVLDPFAGSGSTGVAALAEGARFIGVERDPDYFEIAKARLSHAKRNL